ncbi:hypothetical protein [Mesorhizobium sp.]|uniref:hypothetical protein n=1 Tax=Mesorhizobium sp. TaxID=1871066 RepID=UPI0012018382|nr:hypothetical protein [Mesorhizobium sp.]TIT00948.1 MAG: hypothetical protein E5W87_17355 [Mesorhizobium sp.]
MLINQPTLAPSRKLSAAMISASLAGVIKAVVTNTWPQFADPMIWEPLPIIVGFAVGYFVRERR